MNNTELGPEESDECQSERTLRDFETLVSALSQPRYLLKLYVSGASPRSALAITNVKAICEKYLPGKYDLEVVDIFQQPQAAHEAQIVAVPTLIKELPLPGRTFVGDMTDVKKIVVGLNLKQRDTDDPA